MKTHRPQRARAAADDRPELRTNASVNSNDIGERDLSRRVEASARSRADAARAPAESYARIVHYGHDRVALLDGGIEKWEAEGRPLERGTVDPLPARFESRESGSMRGIGAEEIRQRLEDRELRLVDVRNPAEFSGEQLRAARGGHIPGAILWPGRRT